MYIFINLQVLIPLDIVMFNKVSNTWNLCKLSIFQGLKDYIIDKVVEFDP